MKASAYSKEFRKEAIRLSDEIGSKKGISPTGNTVLYVGRLAQSQQTQAYGFRNSKRGGNAFA